MEVPIFPYNNEFPCKTLEQDSILHLTGGWHVLFDIITLMFQTLLHCFRLKVGEMEAGAWGLNAPPRACQQWVAPLGFRFRGQVPFHGCHGNAKKTCTMLSLNLFFHLPSWNPRIKLSASQKHGTTGYCSVGSTEKGGLEVFPVNTNYSVEVVVFD